MLKVKGGRFWGNILLALALSLFVIGSYSIFLALTPEFHTIGLNPNDNSTTRLLAKQDSSGQILYIPKIDLNVSYDVLESNLSVGAWWRRPSSGNPKDGGNFVLAAHRFEMGLTPNQTQQKSPFYHLEKLSIGDEIFVDYAGKRYDYVVSEKYSVKPDHLEIEDYSTVPKLTLYTCTLGGRNDGRDVIIAQPKSTS